MATGTARLVVAGTASGVGKTTVAVGLMAALAARGRRVAAAKAGPDYIDPSYHRLATGGPSTNLDAVLLGGSLLAPLARHRAAGADVLVVEGVMGLFDGAARAIDDDGGVEPAPADPASTAHVARLLRAPVVLVVDAGATSTSAAATALGFATFDAQLHLAGVIVNGVGSDRHATLVRDAIQRAGVRVLGVLPRDDAVTAPSRHLGLVPVAERQPEAQQAVTALAALIAHHVDLDAVEQVAATAPAWPQPPWSPQPTSSAPARGARAPVALAAGPAFTFGYPEEIELLEAAGAEVRPVDPLRDEQLPQGACGLIVGGGFPEAHAEPLAANTGLQRSVADLCRDGAPVRAECGGLLFLAEALDERAMCGVLRARARMTDRLTLGYRVGRCTTTAAGRRVGEAVTGHEFHHSTIEPAAGEPPAWQLDGERAEGFALVPPQAPSDGGVQASYLHTHWAAAPWCAERFVAAAATIADREAGP